MRSKTNRFNISSRLATFSSLLLLSGSFAFVPSQLQAQSITSSQEINAGWSWFDEGSSSFQSDSGSANSSSFGALNYSVPAVGVTSADTTIQTIFDPNLGSIQTSTIFDVDGSSTGSTGFDWLSIQSTNSVNISDQLSLAPGILGSIRVKVKTTGGMLQVGRILGNGSDAGIGTMETFGSYSTLASSDGITKSSVEELMDSTGGFFPDEIDRVLTVDNEYTLLLNEDLGNNQFDFSFALEDELMLYVQGIDAIGFTMYLENDFLNTIELFANVYDQNGLLIEGATVTSAAGITYRNFSTVPEPSAVWLLTLVLASVGLGRFRR